MLLLHFVLICILIENSHSLSDAEDNFRVKYGGELDTALVDMVKSIPSNEITIVFDRTLDPEFLNFLLYKFEKKEVSSTVFNISTVDHIDCYFSYWTNIVNNHEKGTTLYFVNRKLAEHILIEIRESNLIRRNLLYIFYWGVDDFQRYFLRNIHETMKVVLVTNPRYNAYRIYYNQGTSYKKHHLSMINWWTKSKNLFHHPTIPASKDIFKDFKKRLIYVPVIHKPPWHFVKYTNDSIRVIGGRDDRLLKLLARSLNFRFKYDDPPERIQGSSFSPNGSFEGVLGLICKREYEFFLGDVALTYERSTVVEFSFLTLADSGAFVTHAPGTLNEALALVRPFHWKVWPAIIFTVFISGPVLYVLIALPNAWHPRFLIRSHTRLFCDCFWFTTSLFLRQSEKEPNSSHKTRFFVILLSIAATYVIGDMYSANLTSLLAKPGREKSINTLAQLEVAMKTGEFQLFVEKHSSTYSLLENGTSIYGRLWQLMNSTQSSYLVNSVEEGVKLVRDYHKIAVIAGRETLFFDIQRFGPSNFHLSEKINTAYSAIAFQLGCPYIDNVNRILMAVFEAGILSKMTENEYEKLGKQQVEPSENIDEDLLPQTQKESRKTAKANEDNLKLKAINIKMLQGAFYLLFIGYTTAGLVLGVEIVYNKHSRAYKTRKSKCREQFEKHLQQFRNSLKVANEKVRRKLRNAFNEAIISTFEYVE